MYVDLRTTHKGAASSKKSRFQLEISVNDWEKWKEKKKITLLTALDKIHNRSITADLKTKFMK